MEVLETPKWFKDELRQREERKEQARWMDSFEMHVTRASDTDGVKRRVKEQLGPKIEKVEAMESVPDGLLDMVKKTDQASRRKKVSWYALIYLLAALTYFISPIDACPDFIPNVGLLDDLFLLKYAWDMAKTRMG